MEYQKILQELGPNIARIRGGGMSAIFCPNKCNIFGISRKKAIQYYYYYLFFITRLKLGKTNEKHKEKRISLWVSWSRYCVKIVVCQKLLLRHNRERARSAIQGRKFGRMVDYCPEFLYAKSMAKPGRGKIPENVARAERTNENTSFNCPVKLS